MKWAVLVGMCLLVHSPLCYHAVSYQNNLSFRRLFWSTPKYGNSKNGKYQQVKNFTVRRPAGSPLMFVTWWLPMSSMVPENERPSCAHAAPPQPSWRRCHHCGDDNEPPAAPQMTGGHVLKRRNVEMEADMWTGHVGYNVYLYGFMMVLCWYMWVGCWMAGWMWHLHICDGKYDSMLHNEMHES